MEAIHSACPALPLVVVASGDAERVVRDAIVAGCDGYVSERQLERRLALVIRAVLAGHVCVPRSARREILRVGFSLRERQVLTAVRHGLSNQQIAERLFLSESTVKSHLGTAFRKLGVGSRADAAALLSDPRELERTVGPAAHQLFPLSEKARGRGRTGAPA
jgi:DNA-binding NarL/FixJ family response regulator